jgi:hypothetical protein
MQITEIMDRVFNNSSIETMTVEIKDHEMAGKEGLLIDNLKKQFISMWVQGLQFYEEPEYI